MANTTTVAADSEPVPVATPEPELNLLLTWQPDHTRREWIGIVGATAVVHLVLFALAVQIGSFVDRTPERPILVEHHTPLYFPRDLLTQKAPNRDKLTKQIKLADLMKSLPAAPIPAQKRFNLPKQFTPPRPKAEQPKILPEAPALAMNQTSAPPPPGSLTSPIAPAPPPPAPPSSPFQNVGQPAPSDQKPTIKPPDGSMSGMLQGMAKTTQKITITDSSPAPVRPGLPAAGGHYANQHATIELKSDPEGADLRPYLAEILSIVRANWHRVIPESAVMGRLHGQTVIEFALDRQGRVAKLVVADPSGSTPLDTAAVAGLSMSNPLPPLPADYKGFQLRLAFSFDYNIPAQ
ncbi:MAG: TonB family protein [Bryobacteraceae bacterium]